MRFGVLIPLFIISFSSSAYAQVKCASKQQSSSMSQAIVKAAVENYARNDTLGFCHRNMMLRYLSSRNPFAMPGQSEVPNEMYFMHLTTANLEKLSDQRIAGEGKDPWNYTLVSTPDSRRKALAQISEICSTCSHFEKQRPVSQDERTMMTRNLLKLQQTGTRPVKSVTSVDGLAKYVACAEQSFSNVVGCRQGLDLLQTRITPISSAGGSITRPDIYQKILGNPSYDEGLRRSAALIERRINNPQAGGNFFDDLQSSYQASGFSAGQANQAAWDTVALVATGGADLVNRLRALHENNKLPVVMMGIGAPPPPKIYATNLPQNAAALSYIAAALGSLDSARDQAGLPLYSYPRGVKTACDNAKPYGFWLSAYNTRELVQKDQLNPDAAKMASYSSELAYQAMRSKLKGLPGGKYFSGVLEEPPYSPSAQVIRTDLAYAAAGAEFGARSGAALRGTPIDVNKIIGDSLRESSPSAALSSDEDKALSLVSAYRSWSRIYAPQAVFQSSRGDR